MRLERIQISPFIIFMMFGVSMLGCNTEGKQLYNLEKLLHNNNQRLWDVYDTTYHKTGRSYQFNTDGGCSILMEVRPMGGDWRISIFVPPCIDTYTWNIMQSKTHLYLRIAMDVYRILEYNDKDIKMIDQDGAIFYIHKSPCQENDCSIPETITPPKF